MRADWMDEKSKDVGHVESNALAKGRPFVCLKIIFWQTSSALKNTTRWAAICRPRRTERRCHRAVRDDQKEFRMDGIICLVVKSVKFNFQLAISVGECCSSVNPRAKFIFLSSWFWFAYTCCNSFACGKKHVRKWLTFTFWRSGHPAADASDIGNVHHTRKFLRDVAE